MQSEMMLDLARDALRIAMLVGGPLLVVVFLTSVASSFLQSVMQVQESSLSQIPKLLVAGLVMAVALPWVVAILAEYSTDLVSGIPDRL